MKAVTVYVVLKMTFFAGAEKNRYFSHILQEGLCFSWCCFGTITILIASPAYATDLSRFPDKPLNGIMSTELLVAI